jgi:uncharacterized LabA/DUF88 family protein
MATAILVDGGFFLTRYRALRGNAYPDRVAKDLHWMCRRHLRQDGKVRRLYRIFFYDCPPLSKKVHNPVTGKAIDFAKTQMASWRLAFHDELRKLRKVALRLGYLNERSGHWELHSDKLKALLAGHLTVANLTESDVKYEVRQKGVDMRIGLDIASMAFKQQVDQIVLVAGDSDFVPAAKLARREGIDFILDPMWASIRPDLHEHIDGLRSVIRRKSKSAAIAATTATTIPPAASGPSVPPVPPAPHP